MANLWIHRRRRIVCTRFQFGAGYCDHFWRSQLKPYQTESGISYGWWKRQRQQLASLKLVEAIRCTPEPPCVGCRMRENCATDKLACRDYATFVGVKNERIRKINGDRSPRPWVYELIFEMKCSHPECKVRAQPDTAVDWGLLPTSHGPDDACPDHKQMES